MDHGSGDYFYSDYYCLVEWPEKIFLNLLPESYVTSQIEQKAERELIDDTIGMFKRIYYNRLAKQQQGYLPQKGNA